MDANWSLVLVAVAAAIAPSLVALGAWRSSDKVHKIVNSQRDIMIAKVTALEGEILTLKESILSARKRLRGKRRH